MSETDFSTKLELILLTFANEVLDLERTNERIGAPIDRAKQAIDELNAEELQAVVYAKFGPKQERP